MQGSRVADSRVGRMPRRAKWLVALALAFVPMTVAAAPASASSFGAAAWGYNGSGQLGNGSTTLSRVPVAVSSLSGVTAVSGGGEDSLALLSNGTVMAWGNDREGQLGNGSTVSTQVPVAVQGISTAIAIAAGRQHSMALLSNGTVMSWGSNEEGQLGNGSKATKSTVPVLVKGLTGVTAISAGGQFSLARLSNGTVMSWGAGDEGQLGNGKKAKSAVPVAVKGLTGVTAIAAGGEHALALLSNGTAMSWGANSSLQLGLAAKIKIIKEEEELIEEEEEEPENSAVPVVVQELTGATAIAAGGEHSLALLNTGEVEAWGGNIDGQLGSGSAGGMSDHPKAVVGLSGVTAIAAGADHTIALLSGGTLVGWGYNPDGQLGNNSNVNSPVPVAVKEIGGVAGIAAGGSHSLSFGTPIAVVTSISPNAGAQTGGAVVTITGANLGEASAVHFGSEAASAFTVNSATSITATAPPGVGVVDVTVTTPNNTTPPTPADRFTYIPPPTITKVVPNKGPAAGGTSVTITGTNFAGATSVSFGATPATSFTVNSATSISAVSPPASTGSTGIALTTPNGASAAAKGDAFRYEAPTITSLSPNAGPASGGTLVEVTGTGFAPGMNATRFKFAAAFATSVSCESTTSCTLVTPARKATTLDVAAVVAKTKSKPAPPGDQFTFE